MKRIVLFCAFLAVARSHQTRHTSTCAERNSIGLICSSDCTTVNSCVKNNGALETVEIQKCTNGTSCDLYSGNCVRTNGCQVQVNSAINCTGTGFYPDPYDCQRYHYCPSVAAASVPMECGGRLAYSVATNQCSFTLDDIVCKIRQFNCPTPGHKGTWSSIAKGSVWYICVSSGNVDDPWKPLLYHCPGKQGFNGQECV